MMPQIYKCQTKKIERHTETVRLFLWKQNHKKRRINTKKHIHWRYAVQVIYQRNIDWPDERVHIMNKSWYTTYILKTKQKQIVRTSIEPLTEL